MGCKHLPLQLALACAAAAQSHRVAFVPGAMLEANTWWRGPPIARLSHDEPPSVVSIAGEASHVLCVVDGRGVIHASRKPPSEWICALEFLSYGGLHWVASYSISSTGKPALIGQPLLLTRDVPVGTDATTAAAAQLATHYTALVAATPPNTAALGVYYTTYLSPLMQLYQNITRMFGYTRTMETVLRNESLRFADSVWRVGPAAASPEWRNYSTTCDIMHQEPALGMYCLYRKRANESSGPMPDCPEASRVLQTHAAQMSALGFEFVAPDATNWDGDPRGGSIDSPGSDFYQLRPTEIIAEEFAAARLAGHATPQLSVFAMVNKGGDLWRWYMDELFNNETLLELGLIFRDAASGRKVFIAADLNKTDPVALTQIALNGGRNDTVVPLMWFAPTASGEYEASGKLAYFSRCTGVHVDTGEVDFSTDAWIDPAVPCSHYKTRASPVGSSWTVSTGLSINSVPFGAVRFNGLLLKKQWWDVLADSEPTSLIFSPSFNEFGSRAYSLPKLVGTNNSAFYAVGAAEDDIDRFVLFEDGYGAQRSRSIEPTVEDGGRYFETYASCVRVYRLQAALGIVSNGTGCDVSGEECCETRDDERFVHVWSVDLPRSGMRRGDTPLVPVVSSSSLTSDKGEYLYLLARGWEEVCVPTIFGRGPTATCVDPQLPFEETRVSVDAASRGPFILYSNATSSAALPGVVPLVRCISRGGGGTANFSITNSTTACGAQQGFEYDCVLGYGSAKRDSLFARAVHRCRDGGGRFYTTVNVPCLVGDEEGGTLLFAV